MAVVVCANDSVPLPVAERPLYCFTMKDVITCFTGIRDAEWAVSAARLGSLCRVRRVARPGPALPRRARASTHRSAKGGGVGY